MPVGRSITHSPEAVMRRAAIGLECPQHAADLEADSMRLMSTHCLLVFSQVIVFRGRHDGGE